MWSSFSECLFVCLFWAIYAWQVFKVSDDLDREKEAGDFSLFAQRVSVVELPLEIVLSCWIHLLDENGEVEPALSCLRRWTTSSTKIQVWTTFCLHPNPGYLDTPSWNPDCWLGHVSNPRILPGNIKVHSWPPFHNTRWPLSPLTSKPLPVWVTCSSSAPFNIHILENGGVRGALLPADLCPHWLQQCLTMMCCARKSSLKSTYLQKTGFVQQTFVANIRFVQLGLTVREASLINFTLLRLT